MINKICIYYSDSEAHTFCFWKHFLEICGVFVSGKKIFADTKKIEDTEANMFILGNEDIRWIESEKKENEIYLVKKNATFKSLKGREDIATVQWRDAKYNFYVIEYLFSQDIDDMHEMEELMAVFIEKKLWGSMWLFHEIAHDGKSCFDEMILDACEKTIKELKQKKRVENMWHVNFMSLYCQYMRVGVKTHSLLSRMNECKELILESVKLAKTGGWKPALCVLTGQICDLSSGEKKYAINFYNQALLFQENSEILYKIGQIYEKVYGDNSMALEFYEKAVKADTYYFRARYKIADAEERENQWEKALKEYLKIEYLLRICEKPISIFEILYLYKVRAKILMIYRKHILNQDIINMYSEKLVNFNYELKRNQKFNTMLHCMFGKQKEEEIREKIMQEIIDKFNEIYTNL